MTIVFCVAVFFVGYTLFLYPLLLGLVARRYGREIKRKPFVPRVTVIVAVHNGAAFIEDKLRSIFALEYPREQMEVIVVSDGSTDRTEAIVAEFPDVELLRLPRGGKPTALNSAIASATADIVVLTDVRQRLAPDSLRYLMENFADPTVGVVSAELVILTGSGIEETNVGLYWRYEFWIRCQLSRLDSIFGATGAYYAIRRDLVVPIPADALLDDMHLPLAAFFRQYRLIVDPRARMFDYPTGLESEFWRKVRTLAGNYQILKAYPQLLGWHNRLWLHFVSYKFARLVLPFALIAIAVASWWLSSPWSSLMIGAQAVFYGAALLDLGLSKGSPWRRLTSPIRTFVTLMAAALVAMSVLFIPAERLWRTTTVQRSGQEGA